MRIAEAEIWGSIYRTIDDAMFRCSGKGLDCELLSAARANPYQMLGTAISGAYFAEAFDESCYRTIVILMQRLRRLEEMLFDPNTSEVCGEWNDVAGPDSRKAFDLAFMRFDSRTFFMRLGEAADYLEVTYSQVEGLKKSGRLECLPSAPAVVTRESIEERRKQADAMPQ